MFKHGLIGLAALFASVAHGAPLVDPTRPPTAQPPARVETPPPVALELSSIIYGSERRLARINNSWVAEGQTVGDTRIVRIDADSVRVRRGAQQLTLNMNTAGMRKQPVATTQDSQ